MDPMLGMVDRCMIEVIGEKKSTCQVLLAFTHITATA